MIQPNKSFIRATEKKLKGIGSKIRKIREIRNYSQDYIAQKLNISTKAYSKIENEDTKLSVDRLYELAKILEVKAEDLLNFDEKTIFYNINNHHNGDGVVLNKKTVSDQEREVFKVHIKHLEDEIHFLREELSKK